MVVPLGLFDVRTHSYADQSDAYNIFSGQNKYMYLSAPEQAK